MTVTKLKTITRTNKTVGPFLRPIQEPNKRPTTTNQHSSNTISEDVTVTERTKTKQSRRQLGKKNSGVHGTNKHGTNHVRGLDRTLRTDNVMRMLDMMNRIVVAADTNPNEKANSESKRNRSVKSRDRSNTSRNQNENEVRQVRYNGDRSNTSRHQNETEVRPVNGKLLYEKGNKVKYIAGEKRSRILVEVEPKQVENQGKRDKDSPTRMENSQTKYNPRNTDRTERGGLFLKTLANDSKNHKETLETRKDKPKPKQEREKSEMGREERDTLVRGKSTQAVKNRDKIFAYDSKNHKETLANASESRKEKPKPKQEREKQEMGQECDTVVRGKSTQAVEKQTRSRSRSKHQDQQPQPSQKQFFEYIASDEIAPGVEPPNYIKLNKLKLALLQEYRRQSNLLSAASEGVSAATFRLKQYDNIPSKYMTKFRERVEKVQRAMKRRQNRKGTLGQESGMLRRKKKNRKKAVPLKRRKVKYAKRTSNLNYKGSLTGEHSRYMDYYGKYVKHKLDMMYTGKKSEKFGRQSKALKIKSKQFNKFKVKRNRNIIPVQHSVTNVWPRWGNQDLKTVGNEVKVKVEPKKKKIKKNVNRIKYKSRYFDFMKKFREQNTILQNQAAQRSNNQPLVRRQIKPVRSNHQPLVRRQIKPVRSNNQRLVRRQIKPVSVCRKPFANRKLKTGAVFRKRKTAAQPPLLVSREPEQNIEEISRHSKDKMSSQSVHVVQPPRTNFNAHAPNSIKKKFAPRTRAKPRPPIQTNTAEPSPSEKKKIRLRQKMANIYCQSGRDHVRESYDQLYYERYRQWYQKRHPIVPIKPKYQIRHPTVEIKHKKKYKKRLRQNMRGRV